jgi:hypothetical protein
MTRVAALSLAAALALAACDGGGAGSCAGGSCGGDVVGAWTIVSACSSGTSLVGSASCPTASGRVLTISVSGTQTFRADLTYTIQATTGGTVEMKVPSSCLARDGLTCAQLGESLTNDARYQSADCVDGATCTCVVQVAEQSASAQGTYSTSGGTLSLFQQGALMEERDLYCIQGATMVVSSGGFSPKFSMMASGTLTLERQ